MVLVLVFGAFAFVNTKSAAAEACTITTTLRVGSTGAEVMCLQTLVGVTADGNFGPITKAAVMTWQTSKGLVADGVFGLLSRAAIVVVFGGYPAGCTSTVGFSTTTGLACNLPVSTGFTPAGCTSASGYSPVTGGACQAVAGLPAGCTSTTGYSPTTGDKCDSSEIGTSLGSLVGGAGNIIVALTSTDVENLAIEGQATKVLGVKIEASDSDVSITNLKVTLENTNAPASPYRLTNYIDSVDIYMGSTKVGSADATDFSKNGYVYTKSIALSDAIIRMGSSHKATFYVVFNAVPSIDSVNLDGGTYPATFDVTMLDFRYTDATGIIIVGGDSKTETGITFDSLISSGNVKLTVSKDSSSPEAQNVEVSDTSSTANINLLTFKMKASGDDLSFDQLDVDLTGVIAEANDLSTMISGLQLVHGSDVLASDPTVAAADTGTVTFLLDDTFTISKDATEAFKVVAKLVKVDTNTYANGDSLTVSFDKTMIAPENSVGDIVTDKSGAASGETQTFYATGVNVTDFSSTYTSNEDSNGKTIKQTANISFKVSAFGETYYIPKTIVRTDTTDGTNTQGLVVSLETSAGDVTPTGTLALSSLTSSADTVGEYFEIPDGETRTFSGTVSLTSADDVAITGHGALTVPAFYHLQLEAVRYDTDQAGTPTSLTLTSAQDFETVDKQLDL